MLTLFGDWLRTVYMSLVRMTRVLVKKMSACFALPCFGLASASVVTSTARVLAFGHVFFCCSVDTSDTFAHMRLLTPSFVSPLMKSKYIKAVEEKANRLGGGKARSTWPVHPLNFHFLSGWNLCGWRAGPSMFGSRLVARAFCKVPGWTGRNAWVGRIPRLLPSLASGFFPVSRRRLGARCLRGRDVTW